MRADGIALLLESARQKDAGEAPVPARIAKAPRTARELFLAAREDGRSPATRFGPAGIAILVGILILMAYGIYAG